ncbi:MAG: hypothetical protein ACM359_02360 [Bacillota bacterium]
MATATRAKLRVQWHKARKQYAKVIGYALGRDGTVKKKCWYLGGDYDKAVGKVIELRRRWRALRAMGKTVWDEEPEYQRENAGIVLANAKGGWKGL